MATLALVEIWATVWLCRLGLIMLGGVRCGVDGGIKDGVFGGIKIVGPRLVN